MVSYTESQWISVKYSECFLIALFLYTQLTIYVHIVTRQVSHVEQELLIRAPVRSIQMTIKLVFVASSLSMHQ
jgi:hypothetical protein